MRCNGEQSFFRARRNRRPVGMFHPSATHIVPNMKNKQVPLKRSSTHQRDFIFANLREFRFKILSLFNFAVEHNIDRRGNIGDRKLAEISDLYGRIGERVIVRCSKNQVAIVLDLRTRSIPTVTNIRQLHNDVFATTLRNVHENHGGINERMFGVELRGEWSGIIPHRFIRNRDVARTCDPPSLLVELFDGK